MTSYEGDINISTVPTIHRALGCYHKFPYFSVLHYVCNQYCNMSPEIY